MIAFTLTGMFLGMLLTLGIILIYNHIAEKRDEAYRQRYEERQRQIKLKQKMNETRDTMTQNIMEQARKGLQRRDEG